MRKHAITLAMFIIGDLMLVIGSIAVRSSIATSIIGLGLLALGFGAEVNVWQRVSRRRAHSVRVSR